MDLRAAFDEGVVVEGGREEGDAEGADPSFPAEDAAKAALLRGGLEGVPLGAVDGVDRAKGLGLGLVEEVGGGGGTEVGGGMGRTSSGGGMGGGWRKKYKDEVKLSASDVN